MKVAFVAESVESAKGGAETSTRQCLRHLRDLGVDLELYTRSHLSEEPGLTVRRIDSDHAPRPLRTAAFLEAVDAALQQDPPDLIHAISPCLRADVYQPRGGTVPETVQRNLALRRTRTARAFKQLTNRLNLKQRRLLAIERRLLSRRPPPTVAALSRYVAGQFERHYQLDTRQIRLIFNAVDPPDVSPEEAAEQRRDCRALYGVRDGQFLVLLVAHNFRLKGVGAWLKAFSLMCRQPGPEIRCLIVGHGRSAPYRRRLVSLGLQDRVLFTGPTRNVTRFYQAADVLVHPTYYDPCSRVVLEAMLHHLPCVTTRFNGASEIIADGVTGRVIETPDDPEALASACRGLMSGDARRALQGGHDTLRERLSMRRHATELLALYHELRGRHRR